MTLPAYQPRRSTRLSPLQDRRRCLARWTGLGLLLPLVLVLLACNSEPASSRIVVGTWAAGAVANPLTGTPVPLVLASPGAIAAPFGSPVASPGIGTPFASPVADNRVSAALARDVGPDGQPVDPTTSFPADSAKIYLVFRTTGLPADSHLEAVWVAVDVRAPVPKNYEVTRSTITVAGDQTGNFSVSKPPAGFPSGQYRVDLLLDGKLIGTYQFTVQ